MSGQLIRSKGLRLIVLPFAAMAMYGFSNGEKRDPIIQTRVYDHVERMESAYAFGNHAEATACAEMILLKRDVTIYVDDTNVPRGIRQDASRAIQTAATNWEDSLGREISIRFVPRIAADVIVTYAGNMKYEGREAAGTVRWSRGVQDIGSGQFQYKITASVNLRTHTPDGREMNYGQMLHTAGHEMGHILGLEDTHKSGDLMGPLRLSRPVERATRHEISSLNEVRERAVLVLNRISGKDIFAQVHVEESRAQVLFPTKTIEFETTDLRIVADRRDVTPVRSTRRNRKATKRKKNFSISGMAR